MDLKERAEALGVDVDGRWKDDRLKKEIATAIALGEDPSNTYAITHYEIGGVTFDRTSGPAMAAMFGMRADRGREEPARAKDFISQDAYDAFMGAVDEAKAAAEALTTKAAEAANVTMGGDPTQVRVVCPNVFTSLGQRFMKDRISLPREEAEFLEERDQVVIV